uniref:Mitochondrial carrier protein n=1 Tax=Strombidium rassoulzadegani TaxID=1082188 RepID=A0A7S3FWU3_9SPIT|mmetsp:Transcript_9042/g.15290  ORF Transcript_9042/g.15290 Transcript_9042/m.15290 type:complete len:133 (+) Transcript_9042:686-1084(+)
MYTYEMLTNLLGFQTGQANGMSRDNVMVPFLAGGISRSFASCVVLPINVIRMRLQMRTYSEEEMKAKNMESGSDHVKNSRRYHGMYDAMKKIYKNEGILAFYKGMTPMLIKMFPQSGIFFLTYEFVLGSLRE